MYPSTADLVDASTVEELISLSATQQDALRAEAIGQVEAHCRQPFTAEGTSEDPVERAVDGSGSNTLYLPRRLSALSELAISGTGFTASDVVLSYNHDRLSIAPVGSGNYYTRALEAISPPVERIFTEGPGTITIAGVWGWTDEEYDALLDDITTAIRMDMEDRALANAHSLAGSVRSARALGLSAISQGGLSASLRPGEPTVSTRVARLLRSFLWSAPRGVAV